MHVAILWCDVEQLVEVVLPTSKLENQVETT